MSRRPEILAPGGDLGKVRTALLYGADAVYCAGPDYGLRAGTSNLSHDELTTAVAEAHAAGARLYVTVNIYPRDEDMVGLPAYIRFLESIGVDAVIVADPGVFHLVGEVAPGLERHVSTQANITSASAARFWHSLGASRVVLARELSLTEITRIRHEVPESLELECFVHGAMCMAYSGRCILSQHFTGRDANRGACTQPCRWTYEITEPSRPEAPIQVEEDARGTYFMNAKDMCMIEHIPELVAAGIDSLKIEGRMKGHLYCAMTTRSYKGAVTAYLRDPATYTFDPSWRTDLEQLVHRRYGTGFYFTGPDEAAEPSVSERAGIASEGGYERLGTFAGVVLNHADGRLWIEQRGKVSEGDTLAILHPDGRTETITVHDMRDDADLAITSAPHAKMRYSIPGPSAVPGTLLRV